MRNLSIVKKKFFDYVDHIVENNKISHAYIIEIDDYDSDMIDIYDFVKMIIFNKKHDDLDRINDGIIKFIDNNMYPDIKLIEPDGNNIRKKQYIFSTSSFDSLTELHDIEEGKYSVRSTRNIWDVGELEVFSYQYSLLELKDNNKNIYFMVFTRHETDTIQVGGKPKDYSKTIIIKKFGIKSFDLINSYDEKNSIYINCRVCALHRKAAF